MKPSRRILVWLSSLLLAGAGSVGGGSTASAAAAAPAAAGSTSASGPASGSGASSSSPSRPVFAPPGKYLLSLGDSLAFGYQSGRVSTELAAGTYSPDHFPGYVQPFESSIQTVTGRRQGVVNFACPGETTASLISGPCAFAVGVHQLGYARALHNDYPGSQLGAAVAFLRAHRGQVSPITLSIGANDLNNLFNTCQRDLACVQQQLPATLARLGANLALTLATLRSVAPRAEVIVLTPYNPAYVIEPATDQLLSAGNAVIQAVARSQRARVADGFAAINLAIPGNELAAVCTYTLMCSQADIHPSDAGYLRLADAFWTASGYARLARDRRAA